MIPVYKPFLNKKNLEYAHKAIDSTWISSHGEYLNEVKDTLKKYVNKKYVILTNNGTTALHLAAIGLRFKYPDIKNIIIAGNNFIASYNCFQVNPIFNIIPIDVSLDTWNGKYVDAINKIHFNTEETAILVVHNISSVVNVATLKEKFPGVIIIEDNAEGFTGKYEDKYTGTDALISTCSFFGNKTITSGEGGALFTDDEEIYEHLNSVRGQGYTSEKFIFDKLGYNYRMSNVQAAILCGQLESLEEIKAKKKNVFQQYHKFLSSSIDIKFQENEAGTEAAEWMFGVRFRDFDKAKTDQMALYLYQNEIETRPMFPPLYYHQHYSHLKMNLKNCISLYESCLIFPSYPELSTNEVQYISGHVLKFLKK